MVATGPKSAASKMSRSFRARCVGSLDAGASTAAIRALYPALRDHFADPGKLRRVERVRKPAGRCRCCCASSACWGARESLFERVLPLLSLLTLDSALEAAQVSNGILTVRACRTPTVRARVGRAEAIDTNGGCAIAGRLRATGRGRRAAALGIRRLMDCRGVGPNAGRAMAHGNGPYPRRQFKAFSAHRIGARALRLAPTTESQLCLTCSLLSLRSPAPLGTLLHSPCPRCSRAPSRQRH